MGLEVGEDDTPSQRLSTTGTCYVGTKAPSMHRPSRQNINRCLCARPLRLCSLYKLPVAHIQHDSFVISLLYFIFVLRQFFVVSSGARTRYDTATTCIEYSTLFTFQSRGILEHPSLLRFGTGNLRLIVATIVGGASPKFIKRISIPVGHFKEIRK